MAYNRKIFQMFIAMWRFLKDICQIPTGIGLPFTGIVFTVTPKSA